MNVEVGSSEDAKGFQYKSAKRYWTVPYNVFTEIPWDEGKEIVAIAVAYVPKYSAYDKQWSSSFSENYYKYYGYLSENVLRQYIGFSSNLWHQLYFEEAYVDKEVLIEGVFNAIPTIENIIKLFKEEGMDMSNLFVEITEEEYLSNVCTAEIGKELVNE